MEGNGPDPDPTPGRRRRRVLIGDAFYGSLIEAGRWRARSLLGGESRRCPHIRRIRFLREESFLGALNEQRFDVITCIGHGEEGRFLGDKKLIVIETGRQPPYDFGNAVVHLLSCRTARKLGPELVGSGRVSAFFGYMDDFAFPDDPADAEHFWRADASIPEALARGYAFDDILKIAKRAFLREAKALCDRGKQGCANALLGNFAALCKLPATKATG